MRKYCHHRNCELLGANVCFFKNYTRFFNLCDEIHASRIILELNYTAMGASEPRFRECGKSL